MTKAEVKSILGEPYERYGDDCQWGYYWREDVFDVMAEPTLILFDERGQVMEDTW